jgi:hypothetical protein
MDRDESLCGKRDQFKKVAKSGRRHTFRARRSRAHGAQAAVNRGLAGEGIENTAF